MGTRKLYAHCIVYEIFITCSFYCSPKGVFYLYCVKAISAATATIAIPLFIWNFPNTAASVQWKSNSTEESAQGFEELSSQTFPQCCYKFFILLWSISQTYSLSLYLSLSLSLSLSLNTVTLNTIEYTMCQKKVVRTYECVCI